MIHDQASILVLLHGFSGSGKSWQPLIPTFSERFQVITPDIIGHGSNLSSDPALYEIAHAAKILIDSLNEPFHLLGYSMGGRLALYLATHHPDKIRSLILESASPGLKSKAEREARRKADHDLADKIEAKGIEWFAAYWESLALWDSQTPAQKTQLRKQRLQNNPIGLANSLRGMGTGIMPSLWEALPQLSMPVKLILGEFDSKFVSINQEMAELIPNADLSIVAGAGHTVHLEKAAFYTQLVLDFLIK